MKKIYYLIATAVMALTFASCEDVPSPYGEPTNPNATVNAEPAGTGSADDPFNVAAAIAKCKEVGSTESSSKYYVKGYAASAATADAQYGNVSFYMTDSQEGKGKKFYAFQAAGPDGQKLTEGYTINVGDEVIVYGPIYNYNGSTPETAGKGAAWVVSVNGSKPGEGGGETPAGEAKGSGTQADPYNATAANAYIKTLAADVESDKDIYIKGKLVKYANNGEFSTQYGNASFYLSDDGTEGSEQFYVFRALYLGNKKYTEGETPKVGDEIVICGKVVNYKGNTPETAANKSYIYSLNGKTADGGGGGDTPTPPSEGNMTKAVNGTVVTFTSSTVTGSDEVTVDFNEQGWENQATATTVTLANGTKIEFAGGENTNNSPTFYSATKGVRVYAKNLITVKGTKAIAKIVMNCDSYNGTDYVGNDMMFANAEGNTVTICNDFTEAKGGVQVRVQTMIITFEGEGTGGGQQGGGDNPQPAVNTGTLEAPLTASEAYDAVAAMEGGKTSSEDYYVKGKISSIKYEFSAQYGTATFNISDDGAAEGSKQFIAYSCYYFGNQPWVDGNTQVKVGDEVIVCGKVVNYNGNTPEFASKKNYLVVLNGQTK